MLQIDIENGGSTTVDLSSLDDSGTDDQNISGSGLAGNILTIGIENGTNETVDLSALVGTDDQNLTGASLSGANILQIDIENGGSTTVDLSSLDDSGTDDQTAAEVTYDNTTSGLTAADVQAALDEVAAGSTDDQNISGSGLAGNILTIGIENGTNETVDLSALVGTDDQNITLAANSLSIEDGNSVDLSPYLDNTDEQDLTGASLSGANILQIDIENGASTTVDLSSLDDSGTDDQTISTDGSAGNISIEDGNTVVLNVDDADADATNEYNTAVGMNTGALEVTDGGGTLSTSLISTDANNDIASGSDGALYLNVSSVTISETITNLVDNANGTITYTNENGVPQTVSKANITDNADGTYTFTNNDGSDVILDTNANSNPYDNTTSGLTATDVQAALDEVATGSTDDQNISGSGLAGNILTIGIENGTNETVDLSALVGTDDQNLTGASLSGANILQIDIENGGSTTVDLSSLDDSGTDDQTAAEVTYDNTVSGLTATDVKAALDEVAAGSTDDQNISGSGLAGNILTIGIENGTNETVDLSALVGTDDQNLTGASLSGANILQIDIENGGSTTVDLSSLDDSGTDDQNISGSGLAGNILTIGIENGTNETVDLSALVGTDDQIANEVNITDAGGNFVATEVEGALAELAAGSTDDQNISGSGLAGNILTIGIENGTNETVDLSALVGTDDQIANEVNITDAGGNFVATEVEGALAELAAGSTDDQNISGSGLAGNILTIGIENGTNETVDLSALVGTDDQTAAEVTYDNTISGLTATDVKAALDEVAAGSTDDQNLTGATLSGANVLQIDIENGGSTTVDLSSLDDSGTDDQNISGSGLAGNILTIGIENGTNETVDLSALVGTDDQIANEVNITDAGGNFVATEVEGALAELAAGSTDDQNISGSGLAGNILTIGIENGTNETVDLSALVGTDDQNLTGATLSGANVLQIDIENGGSTTVDLSSLDDSGTRMIRTLLDLV